MTTTIIAKEQQREIVSPSAPEQSKIAPTFGPCSNLCAALAQARDRCKAAAKDAKNTFHGYSYASSEEVIATASDAMEGTGLTLIPFEEQLSVLGTGSEAIYCLHRTFLLSHSSGEHIPLRIKSFPVMPDKGRPVDKAYLAALTESLAYKLRDLLQMPRGEQFNISGRDDSEVVATQPPVRSQSQAEPQPTNGAPQGNERRPATSQPAIATEQVERISALVDGQGMDWGLFGGWLQEKHGVANLRQLTPEQADKVERSLIARAKKQAVPA